MKPRHIAALALTGWYLMAPVGMSPGSRIEYVDQSLPVSRWKILESFDTAAECEGQMKSLSAQAQQQQHESMRRVYDAAECLATDDPRLGSRPVK